LPLLAGGLLAGLYLLLPLRAAAQQTPEIGFPIIVTDDIGGKQVLELGIDPNATSGNDDPKFGEGRAPPFPPNPNTVVARFIDADVSGVTGIPDGTGMNVDIRQGASNFSGQKVHEIKFETGSNASRVTFRWDLPAGVTGTIKDKFNGAVYGPKNITGSGSFTVSPGDPDAIITLSYDGTQKPPHRTTIPGEDGTGNDTGWRLLAPPSGAVRGDLQDDLSFDVDSGHLLHTWAGGGPNGWSAATNASDRLSRGEGFILYFFDDNIDEIDKNGLPLDVSNEGESQNESVAVDNLNTGNRFHLLGNPYDAPFDLSGLAGGDLSGKGFQQAVQVWNPDAGQFKPVMQGSGSDEIDPWQGFIVERTTPGQGPPSIAFNASGRQPGSGSPASSEASPIMASGQQANGQRAVVGLELSVDDGRSTARRANAIVLLDEEATAGWDGYDATRISPPGGAAAAASLPIRRDGGIVHRVMASAPYPAEKETRAIPLSVQASAAGGVATIRWPKAVRGQVPDSWTVELEDRKTEARTDLRGEACTFDIAEDDADLSGPENARFLLHAGPATAVPVELAGFEAAAEGKAVRLTWQTASEQNNAGFYVQRKARASAGWKRLGFVESKVPGGTTSEPKRYRFRDTDLPYAADTLAYRLRQVDTDGTAHTTKKTVVALSAPGEVELKPPFPNPARQRATLRFALPGPTAVQVDVYDLLGRRVATIAEERREAGRHEETLPVAAFPPGIYLVRMQAGKKVRTRKITVVR
jgi:hypothetical protein